MKNLSLSLALAASLCLTACFPFDEPGDELAINTNKTDENVYHGDVDKLDYTTEHPLDSVSAAIKTLESNLAECRGGIHRLRGSNNNTYPNSHGYQYQYSFGPDGYCGYFVVPHSDFAYGPTGSFTSTYCITPGYASGAANVYGSKNTFIKALNHPSIDFIPEVKALILLYYSLSAQEYSDLQGPFPYNDHKKNKQSGSFVYDDLKTIYTSIVKNLDDIVACMKALPAKNSDYKTLVYEQMRAFLLACFDDAINDDAIPEYYYRFANSLKLRMALRIVKVEPALAQQWAEEAVASGVINDVNKQPAIYMKSYAHPMVEIMKSWNDSRLNASFESILASLDHPFFKDEFLFLKNDRVLTNVRTKQKAADMNTVTVGLRAGTLFGALGQGSGNPYLAASRLNDNNIRHNMPIFFIKLAEVEFLRAEGALRGWNMGGESAETLYYKGIDCGYYHTPQLGAPATWASNIDAYKNRENPEPFVQNDLFTGKDPWKSVTTIGVKWNDAEDNETKLEKIITQKYIANFPNSHLAWAELRRTGYPKIFPVLNPDDGDFSLNKGDMIRRIPWNSTDPQTIVDIATTGVPALGGEDVQATRLWWDKDQPNF